MTSGLPDAGDRPRAALITGAASGIGRATALELGRRGYALTLFDQDARQLAASAAELTEHGVANAAVSGTVTSSDDLRQAVQAGLERFGRLDACAACAGVEVWGKLSETTAAQWERAISVNLMGVVNTVMAVLPSLVSARGCFVAISSDAGVQGFAEWAAYCASKHAVVGLVRSMAVELGPLGVRSNVVCPGFVDTPMAKRIFAEAGASERADSERTVPLGRFARADEVASVVCHLLSDEASYTNGLVYSVDGGGTAGGPAPIPDR